MENNPFVQTRKAFGGVAGEDRGVVARALERILRVCAADGAHNSQVSGEPRIMSGEPRTYVHARSPIDSSRRIASHVKTSKRRIER